MIENVDRTLRSTFEKTLSTYKTDRDEVRSDWTEWDTYIPQLATAINSRHIQHLGYSPNQILSECLPRNLWVRNRNIPDWTWK